MNAISQEKEARGRRSTEAPKPGTWPEQTAGQSMGLGTHQVKHQGLLNQDC